MWKIINFKNNKLMVNNPFYNIFAKIFADNTLSLLVKNFNAQVGNRGWTSTRAAYDCALLDEFIRRGYDVSAIYDGTSISFRNEIKADEITKRIEIL